MADLGQILKDAVGVIGGGKSQVGAVALSAKAAQIAQGTRNDIKHRLIEFGKKLGPDTGADLFKWVAQGAEATATPAVAMEQRRLFGFSTGDAKIYLVLGIAVIIGLAVWRPWRYA